MVRTPLFSVFVFRGTPTTDWPTQCLCIESYIPVPYCIAEPVTHSLTLTNECLSTSFGSRLQHMLGKAIIGKLYLITMRIFHQMMHPLWRLCFAAVIQAITQIGNLLGKASLPGVNASIKFEWMEFNDAQCQLNDDELSTHPQAKPSLASAGKVVWLKAPRAFQKLILTEKEPGNESAGAINDSSMYLVWRTTPPQNLPADSAGPAGQQGFHPATTKNRRVRPLVSFGQHLAKCFQLAHVDVTLNG